MNGRPTYRALCVDGPCAGAVYESEGPLYMVSATPDLNTPAFMEPAKLGLAPSVVTSMVFTYEFMTFAGHAFWVPEKIGDQRVAWLMNKLVSGYRPTLKTGYFR